MPSWPGCLPTLTVKPQSRLTPNPATLLPPVALCNSHTATGSSPMPSLPALSTALSPQVSRGQSAHFQDLSWALEGVSIGAETQ